MWRRWLQAPAVRPLGRWLVDGDWERRALLATQDSCGGDLCREAPPLVDSEVQRRGSKEVAGDATLPCRSSASEG